MEWYIPTNNNLFLRKFISTKIASMFSSMLFFQKMSHGMSSYTRHHSYFYPFERALSDWVYSSQEECRQILFHLSMKHLDSPNLISGVPDPRLGYPWYRSSCHLQNTISRLVGMNSAGGKLMDIRIDFVQNSAGGNSTYIRGIPASGRGPLKSGWDSPLIIPQGHNVCFSRNNV